MSEIRTAVLFLVISFLIFMGYLLTLSPEGSSSPKIKFQSSSWIDKLFCSKEDYNKIQYVWNLEHQQSLLRYQALWNRWSHTLLKATASTTRKPFLYSERKVFTYLCPKEISFFTREPEHFGQPLFAAIQINPYLSFSEHRRADLYFVDSVFHTLLHSYILWARFPHYLSQTMADYYSEHSIVRSHLHIFALQKYVYLSTNNQQIWFYAKERWSNLSPHYKRAIEIIETAGTKPFIDEL